MLNRRQINVQRGNLAAMCRISVKSLIDHACLYTHVDDDSEEFINFCAVFEQLVSHRLRPYPRKMWLPRGSGSPRHFWEVLLEQHQSNPGQLYQTCIPNIEAIETLKSPKAKLRAFLRVALMEKRLSDYMNWLLNNTRLMRESYMEGALLASDDASVLCADLIGLNAIDFNFCLKGNENELLGPLEINYGPFLKYKQSSASQSHDEIEMLQLSGKEELVPQTLTDSNLGDLLKLQSLERDFKAIKEQKDYLEELVRLRERQIMEMTQKCERILQEQLNKDRDWEAERKTVDSWVLELQAGMTSLRRENDALRSQVIWFREFKQKMEMREVPMLEMSTETGLRPEEGAAFQQDDSRLHLPSYSQKPLSEKAADQGSIMSTVSDQIHQQDDTTSMVPLTGSLADVNIAMLEASTKSSDTVSRIPASIKESTNSSESDWTNDHNDGTKEGGTYTKMDSSQEGESQQEEETLPVDIGESYVITDGSPSGEKTDMASCQVTEDSKPGTASIEEGSTASLHPVNEPSHVMIVSDGAVSTDSSELSSERGTTRENLTSDPELIERGNTSSDGSETAWDMLSDSEPVEQKGESAQQ